MGTDVKGGLATNWSLRPFFDGRQGPKTPLRSFSHTFTNDVNLPPTGKCGSGREGIVRLEDCDLGLR